MKKKIKTRLLALFLAVLLATNSPLIAIAENNTTVDTEQTVTTEISTEEEITSEESTTSEVTTENSVTTEEITTEDSNTTEEPITTEQQNTEPILEEETIVPLNNEVPQVILEDYGITSEYKETIEKAILKEETKQYTLIAENCTDSNNNLWYVYEKFRIEDDTILSCGYCIFPQSVDITDTLVIPATVSNNGTPISISNIGSESFKNVNAIVNLTIENGINAIGYSAFENSGVHNIDIANSVKYFEDACFANNTNITEFTYPTANESIVTGSKVFKNCTNLSKVILNNSITNISAYCFENCTSLTNIDLPSSVVVLEYECFKNTGLTSIDLNYIKFLAGGVFNNCSNLTTVNWGNCDIQLIDYRTFYNCTSLTNITIPDTVTKIGCDSFNNCPNITELDLNNITYLDYCAFANTGITELIIPETVTYVNVYAFGNCNNLKKVTIKNNLATYVNGSQTTKLFTVFGPMSYNSYSGAWDAKYGVYNKSIEELIIDSSAFDTWSCNGSENSVPNEFVQELKGLKTVTLSDNIKTLNYHSFFNCPKLETITLSNQLNAIQDEAFMYCSSLRYINPTEEHEVNFPASLWWIGNYSFMYCTSITDLNLDSGIGHIGEHAFEQCTGVKSARIGSSIEFIGEGAFKFLDNCTEIYYNADTRAIGDGSKSWYGDRHFYDMFWTNPTTGRNLDTFIVGNNVSYIVEEEFNFMPVKHIIFEEGSKITELPAKAVFDNEYLQDIVLPENLETIGESCFQRCYSLKEIDLPNSVKSIGTNGFFDCYSLEEFNIDPDNTSLESIGNHAFFKCASLKEVYIPKTLKSLGVGAYYCTFSVEKITIDNAVINDDGTQLINPAMYESADRFTNVFTRNDKITCNYEGSYFPDLNGTFTKPESKDIELIITSNVKQFNNSEFENMPIYKVVFNPDTIITTIPVNCFANNSKLEDVSISNSITTIKMGAFDNCDSLTAITLPQSVQNVENFAFDNCSSLESIYVYNPDIKIDAYTEENPTHIDTSEIIKKYNDNTYEYVGNNQLVIQITYLTNRNDTSINEYNNGIPVSKDWITDKDTIVANPSQLTVSNGQLVMDNIVTDTSSITSVNSIFDIWHNSSSSAIPCYQTLKVYTFNSSENDINTLTFTDDYWEYIMDIVQNNGSDDNPVYLVRFIAVPKSASTGTIPDYTNIYAYRYTTENWITPGYNHTDDLSLYNETAAMCYHNELATERTGKFYPLDEVITIDGNVKYPNQLKGTDWNKFNTTVIGTRRDSLNVTVNDYSHDYDKTDITIGPRDVELKYKCPVSLTNGNPTDTVAITINDERKVTIKGNLTLENEPIANCVIKLSKQDETALYTLKAIATTGSPTTEYTVVTDAKGNYIFEQVEVGTYKLTLYNTNDITNATDDNLLAEASVYVKDTYNYDDNSKDTVDITTENDGVTTDVSINGDIFKIDAMMEIPKYDVIYDYSTNGGTSVTKESDSLLADSDIDLTPIATKDGYTFIGWNTDKDATTALTSLKIGKETVTLYAIYKKDIKITYHTYDSTYTITKTIYNNETEYELLLDEYKGNTEYTFSGYVIDENKNIESTDDILDTTDTIVVTKNIDIYCVYVSTGRLEYYTTDSIIWKTDTDVNYYVTEDILNPTYNYKLIEGPILEGYVFDNWVSSDSTKYKANDIFTTTNSTEKLKAIYSKVVIPVQSIEVTPEKAEIYVNDHVQLTATVLPENADNKVVKWHSENSEIATVDQNGLVIGKQPGTVKIYATTTDGTNLSDYSVITVTNPVDTRQVIINGTIIGSNEVPIKNRLVYIERKETVIDSVDGVSTAVVRTDCRTDENGNYTFNDLSAGTYNLCILDTDGTTIITKCEIIVGTQDNIKVDNITIVSKSNEVTLNTDIKNDVFTINAIVDVPDDNPLTGDDFNPFMYLSLMIFAFISLFVLKKYKK